MERWAGRIAVVTGASVGIGAAIVNKLLANDSPAEPNNSTAATNSSAGPDESYSFVVPLFYVIDNNSTYFCHGVIYEKNMVISVKQCFDNLPRYDEIEIEVKEAKPNSTNVTEQTILMSSLHNANIGDLVLLKLDSFFHLDGKILKSGNLINKYVNLTNGKYVGWTKNYTEAYTVVDVDFTNQTSCEFKNNTSSGLQVCAHKSVCFDKPGAPLVIRENDNNNVVALSTYCEEKNNEATVYYARTMSFGEYFPWKEIGVQ